jgi:hypothetical protein
MNSSLAMEFGQLLLEAVMFLGAYAGIPLLVHKTDWKTSRVFNRPFQLLVSPSCGLTEA